MGVWVNCSRRFQIRGAALRVSDRDLASLGLNLYGILKEESTELVEKLLLDFIKEVRPDLEGGFLYAIEHAPPWGTWILYYEHHSFAPIDEGSRPPELPLIPIRNSAGEILDPQPEYSYDGVDDG